MGRNLLHINDFIRKLSNFAHSEVNDSSMMPDFALCAKIWRVQETGSSKVRKLND